jgi:hypothetical protein
VVHGPFPGNRGDTRGVQIVDASELWIRMLVMLLVGPRRFLTWHAAVDDEPTLEELDAAASMPELYELLLDQRDQLLVEALTGLHEQRCHEAIRIAVVYGAAHMPAVVHALSARYRYVVREGQYVTVLDL